MSIFELSALLAATLWAFGSLISSVPSKALGAIAFGQIRMVLVSAILIIIVLFNGGLETINSSNVWWLLLSGFIGIFIGDTALYLTLNRLGPRRMVILFSLSAPISALLSWMFLEEKLTLLQVGGIIIVIAGVMLAVIFGKRKSQIHQWEKVNGPLWIGIAFGVLAALCQALGSIFAKPALDAGVDPFAASLIRTAVSAAFLTIMVTLPFKQMKPTEPVTWRLIGYSAGAAFVGMALGMSFFLFALSGGEVGIISTIAATEPAILLPILWIKTKEPPAIGAWIGAGLVIIGTYFLVG